MPDDNDPLRDLDDDDDVEDVDDAAMILPCAETTDQPIPALRECSAQMVEMGGPGENGAPAEPGQGEAGAQPMVLLEDPEQVAPRQVLLPTWAYMVATMFDGRQSARSISLRFEEKVRVPLPPDKVLAVQDELDRALMLYSRRFERTVRRKLEDYLDAHTRPMSLAGQSYPKEPAACTETIERFFSSADGPGKLPPPAPPATDTVRGLIVPHYELTVAGPTYAHGYARLLDACDAEVFVLLGVAHRATAQGLYFVSTKNYETPYGTAENFKQLSTLLQDVADVAATNAELAHRGEFSIEFQTTLLSALLSRAGRPFQIVPVLCGSADLFLQNDADPFEDETFKEFTETLRNALASCGKKWCVLSSVDLSHCGPEYGHSAMMNERLLPPVRRGDLRFLEPLARLDARAAYSEIVRTQNSRHVDAVLSTLTLLETIRGSVKEGRLLRYAQTLRDGTHSACSYAAMSFEA